MLRLIRLAVLCTLSVTFLVPAAARAQDSSGGGTGRSLEDQILDLKELLDAETRRQAELGIGMEELDGQIKVITSEAKTAERAVASAESGVETSQRRVGLMAKALYRRPMTHVSTFLSSRSLNDYVVGQDYLSRALDQDRRALEEHQAAKAERKRLQDELRDRQAELTRARTEREKVKQIVDASILNQQAQIARLEGLLATARSTGTLPWGGFPGCDVAPRTNLPGPWTLEDWAAATLKSLALRSGRPVAEVLTAEHVAALIAFAWGEGGGTNNHKGWFNPLNTNGWTRLFPELQGKASGFGTDDWPTFDAGVEATARALTSRTQNRLGKTLLIPTSTAADFFAALASSSQYEGNKNWSADDSQHVGKYSSILARLRSRYVEYGSTLLQASGQPPTPGVPRAPTGVGPPGFAEMPMGC